MKSQIISGLVGGLIVAAFLAAGIASGAVNDPIRAGKTTTYGGPNANSTELEGSPAAPKPLLILDKNTNGPVLRLEPLAGQPALSLSNAVKIPNLNADMLDGLDSGAFLQPAVYTVVDNTAVAVIGGGANPCMAGILCILDASCDPGDTISTTGFVMKQGDEVQAFQPSGNVRWILVWINALNSDDTNEGTLLVTCFDLPPLRRL
jgi:hypothetical protein